MNRFKLVCALLLTLGLEVFAVFATSGVCYKQTAITEVAPKVTYLRAYRQHQRRYDCGFWGWRRCIATYSSSFLQSLTMYFINTTYVMEPYCCAGYVGAYPSCKASCSDCCQNGGTCILPKVCKCTPGWNGSCCDIDINECGINNICDHICVNTYGSFYCGCYSGFELQSDNRTCEDLNECRRYNECAQTCVNTVGSFYCSCWNGYELADDNRTCTDVKECLIGIHNCSQLCIELDGGYACSCYDGYDLEDGFTCKAQGNCTITPINSTTLTIIDGRVLPITYGMQNVMIQCNCSDIFGKALDPVRWFDSYGIRINNQTHHEYELGTPYFTRAPDDKNTILTIPMFNESYHGIYSCGVDWKFPKEPTLDITLSIDFVAEFYIGFSCANSYSCKIHVILATTEKEPVFYLIEAPAKGYYRNGTVTSDHKVFLTLPSNLLVFSYDQQDKGICIKTSSNKVTIQGVHQFFRYGYYNDYYYYENYRQLETFVAFPVIDLCSSEYEYYAVSVNSSSYYDSSVLVVGTEDNTMIKLIVTQPVTISVGNVTTYLIPNKEYPFMINRLQTVYIGSPGDLTGSKVITDKQVSVFSGHHFGRIFHSPHSYLVEQIPPSVLWGKVYYVTPLKDVQGYAIKIVTSSKCVIKIYCNSSLIPIFTTALNSGESIVKQFSNNEFCMIESSSEVLVAQFSIRTHYDTYSEDIMMALVPSKKQYFSKFKFADVANGIYDGYYYYHYSKQYNYANIIVLAQYFQPDQIYLSANEFEEAISLENQQWTPIKAKNITEAYVTQLNVTYDVVEIYHTNETALMTVMVYGFSQHGSHGVALTNHINKGVVIGSQGLDNHTIELFSNSYNLSIDCKAVSLVECYTVQYKWHKASKLISTNPKLVISNLKIEDAGQYQCTAFNSLGGLVSKTVYVDIKVPAPHIVTQPANSTAAAPFSAVFTCSVRAYGNLSFNWRKSHSDLPKKHYVEIQSSLNGTTSFLFIPNVTRNDIGEYYCDIWANNKASRSNVVMLQFSGKPTLPKVIISPSSNISLKTNDFNISMRCIPHDKRFVYQYTWEKQNDTLPVRAKGINLSSLTITDVQTEDTGMYRCKLSNFTGRIASKYKRLIVKVKLPFFIKHPDAVTVNISMNVTFKCIAKGFGLTNITWRKVGSSRLPSTATVLTKQSSSKMHSILTITSTAGYYTGKYYCVATNTAGHASSNQADLLVQVPCPEMIRMPKNVTALPGRVANFSCLVLSFGGLVYDWIRINNASLSQSAIKTYKRWQFSSFRGQIAAVYHLVVMNIKLSDEGWYCCVATNECGYIKKCAWLEVNTLPNITTQPKSVLLKAGSNQINALLCLATGMPPILYQWEKYQSVDHSWIKPSQRAENITTHSLVFNGITEEDEGIYHCIATNNDGSIISDNASITVYGPPNITYIDHHKVSLEGSKASFICIATNDNDSDQSLFVQWYNHKNVQVISDNSRILIHSTTNMEIDQIKSILLFDPVNRTDSGMYTCKVFNDPKCYTQANTSLTVEYPPCVSIDPPQSTYNVTVGSRLILYCSACGVPTPKVQWLINNSRTNQHPPEIMFVPTTSPHTTLYTCIATNNAGNATHNVPKNITVIVQNQVSCPPPNVSHGYCLPINNGLNKIVVCNNGRLVIIKCEAGQWKPEPPWCT